DQGHIAKQAGIAGQVDFLALRRGQQKAAGCAAGEAIRKTRAMRSMSELEIAKGMVESATNVLPMRFVAFGSVVTRNLIIGNDQSAGALCNRLYITGMVP